MPEKNEDTATETEDQEVEVTESLLEKVADKMRDLFATKEALVEAVEKIAPEGEQEETSAEKETTDEIPDAIQKQLAVIEKSYSDKFDVLEKGNTDLKTQLEKAEGKLDLAEELAKSEKELRLEREYIEKADTLRVLPITKVELGAMLFELSKSVSEEAYGKWEALLKAMDQQAFAAGLFNEMGSTATPEELEIVEKVAVKVEEGTDPKEALLSLTKADQEQLRTDMAYSDKRGG